jgi:hypothetical protein
MKDANRFGKRLAEPAPAVQLSLARRWRAKGRARRWWIERVQGLAAALAVPYLLADCTR